MKQKFLILVAFVLLGCASVFAQVQSCVSSTSISNNITTGVTYSSGIYDNGGSDITIQSGGILTIDRSTLQMSAGKKITVKNGGVLNLAICHIFGCSAMWQGIVVEEGGIVISSGASGVSTAYANIIEDASIALQYSFSPGTGLSTAYSPGHPLLDLEYTIFNRNEIGIQLNGHPDGIANPILTLNMADIFKIGNCIFTCRDIHFDPAVPYDGGAGISVEVVKQTTLSAATTYPATPASYTSPYINSSTYSETNANAYLKSPYTASTAKSRIGIDLENFFYGANGLYIGYTNGSQSETKTTIFDNQDVGIWAYWSGFTLHNCTFQQPNPNLNSLGGYATGVYMDQGLAASNATLETTGNYPNNAFFEMDVAIYGFAYIHDVAINHCDITSSVGTNTNTSYSPGTWGILLNLSYAKNIAIDNNNIYDIIYAVYVYEDASGGDDNMAIEAIGNHIYATNPNITTAAPNNLVTWGIILMGGSYTLGYANNRTINCSNNFLHDVQNGITLQNWQGCNTHVDFNEIRLKLDPATSSSEYYGIWLVGNIPVDDNIIDPNTGLPKTNGYAGNTVTGNPVDGNGDTYHQVGIYSQQQYGTNYGCNTVNSCEHGIKFFDMCYSTVFWDNTMNESNQYGFTLDQGLIGQQGSMPGGKKGAINPGCPSNNHWPNDNAHWLSHTPQHYKTYNYNSYNINSALVVKNTITENPNGCGALYNPSMAPIYPYQHTGTTLSNTNTLLYWTATLFPGQDCGRCDGSLSRTANISEDEDAANMETLEQIANESIVLPADDADQRLYSLQQQLYETLKSKPDLATSSTDLQSFLQTYSWTAFDFIHYTAKYLAAGNLANANVLLNYWPTATQELDDNYKQYFTWLSAMKANHSYKPSTTAVLALASKCPLKSGRVVYAARALYNRLTHTAKVFANNCDGGVASRSTKPVKNVAAAVAVFSIYPNPITNGSFTVLLPKGTAAEALNWFITVIDVYGKVVLEKQVAAAESKYSLNAPNGLYIATLFNKGSGKQFTTKIVVQ